MLGNVELSIMESTQLYRGLDFLMNVQMGLKLFKLQSMGSQYVVAWL